LPISCAPHPLLTTSMAGTRCSTQSGHGRRGAVLGHVRARRDCRDVGSRRHRSDPGVQALAQSPEVAESVLPLITRAFSADWIPAVRAFNKRLGDGGSASRFPEHPLTPWLPKISGREVFQDLYLATEGEHVRGGFILKRQEFSIRRQKHRIAHLKLPISEGIVNKAYAPVGLFVIRSALQEEPRLFCLGMGAFDMPLARIGPHLP